MEKLERLKNSIAEIQLSEGEGFVLNQMNLSEEMNKYETENASLIIKIITILGGLLGSTFLVSFISLIFQLNKNQNFILWFGLILIALSVLSSRFSKLLIFDTIFVSTLLWGIMLVAVSSSSLKVDERWVSLYFLCIGLFTIVLTKNSYQILTAVFVIAGSLLWMIQIYQYYWLFHGYIILIVFGLIQIYLHEATFISSRNILTSFYNPLRIGLVIVLMISLGLVSVKSDIKFDIKFPWISSVPIIFAIIIMIRVLMTQLGVIEKKSRVLVYSSTLIALALTAISPAINASILVLLLCFYVNYKTGFAIGILSLIYFVCMFYYQLDFSLLIKSEMLLISGIIFGSIYFLYSKKLMTDEKN